MVAVANAGADQEVQQLTEVVLDGSASTGTLHEWSLVTTDTSFDPTYLAGSLTDTASFTAPGEAGTLTFQLVVTDETDGTSDTDQVVVTVALAEAKPTVWAPPFVIVENRPRPEDLVVYSTDRSGGVRQADFPVIEGLTFSERLNAPGDLQLTIPNERLPDGRSLDRVLSAGEHEIHVEQRGRLVWAGPIITVAESPTDAPGSVVVGAEGLLAYARRWHIWGRVEGSTSSYTEDPDSGDTFPPGRLTDIDQAEVLRRLWDFQANKRWGVTWDLRHYEYVIPTGVLRTRTYNPQEYPNVLEMMTNLANVINGLDFAVTPDRRLRTWYPMRGRRRRNFVLHNGNATALTRQDDASTQGSWGLAVGAGEGPDQLHLKRVDWNMRERYGPTSFVYTNTDVAEEQTLVDQVRDELEVYGKPTRTYTLEVYLDAAVGLEPGDIVRVNYSSGYSDVDEWRRVIALNWKPFDDRCEVVVN